MLFKKLAELFPYKTVDQCTHIGISELLLCLPFKLRFRELHGNNNGNSFQHIITGQFIRICFDDVILFPVIIDYTGKCCFKPGFVHAAFRRIDIVGKGNNLSGVAVIILI